MRIARALAIAALFTATVWAVEDSSVLFFAPFEDSADARLSAGVGVAKATGSPQFEAGVRGKAVKLDADSLLTYAFKGNVVPDEGTIMMWVKPEWRPDDDKFHHFFRASTGNFGGKALNAIMLYKYVKFARFQLYTSNGLQAGPHDGRSMAARENMNWEPGQWVHLAATWSATLANTEMYLYVNGERITATGGAVFVPDRAPETFDLGGPVGSGTTWFDDVLVFSRPLMAKEIAEVHRAYQGGRLPGPTDLPFVSTRGLQLRAFVLFARNEFVVEADSRGLRRELGGQTGSVEVVARGRRGELRGTAGGGVARFVFDCGKLGPGACSLRATVSDASRKTLGSGELSYDIPEKPVWLGNDLGKTDTVLPPWTPLRADENSFETWGRKYVFDGSPLPVQVVSQERRLLRSPVELTVRADGTEATLNGQPRGKPEGNEAVVSGKWEGTLGPLRCSVTSRVEFDGFMLLDFELNASKPTEVDELKLVIPFSQDAATLYHHANASWSDLSDAGAVGAAGWSKPLPFVPYYWVGTEKGGLAWFCEHNQNWRNADASRAVELAHGKDGVNLTVRFIDKKTALTEPLRLTFGFMATPVKPLPAGWRDWRHFSISAISLESFVKQGWAAPGCRNIGHLWNNHVGSFSYLPAKPSEMREKVTFLHANGWPTVMSYYALDYTQVGTPDFVTMEREWRRSPYAENDCPGGSFGSVCNASTWADFLVWAVAKTMDETGTDGAYLDCTSPNFCQSAEHGCAPGRFPLLATRELHKRIYAIAKQKRGPNGHVFSHISENNLITTFSFADAVLNGEQYNRKDLRTLTFDRFRAEFIPHSLGVPSVLLPTLVKYQPDKKEKMPGAEFLAFPLLHDVVCMHSWMGRESQELNKRMQAVLHDFGVADAEFLPYWDNAAELTVTPKGATVSGYLRRDGKAALVIAQGPATPRTFQISPFGRLAALRGQPARNALTGEPMAWDNGQFVWPALGKSVQLARIGPADEKPETRSEENR